ncbi:MAG: thymidylate synthase, partial [Methanococcus sp.]|nr:thymidylate synthase [Methanococcus sp.]
MKITVLYSGNYGERVLNTILEKFAQNIVSIHEIPENLPEYIDDVSEYVPENLKESDLIISVGLFGDINLIVCDIAKKTNAKSIIIESHSPKQVTKGLKSEISDSLNEIKIVFPKPFCSLKPVGDTYIDEFAKYFGSPEIEIIGETIVKSVTVKRNAPCGSTKYVAENLTGYSLNEVEFES